MGNDNINAISTPTFNQQEWTYLQHQPAPQEYGIYRTLQHNTTNQLLDEYHFIWNNSSQYNYDVQFFNWRQHIPNIVNCKYVLYQNRDKFCSRGYLGRIYIEHIKIRLCQISDIPFPDNLFLLIKSFQAYKRLYQICQYFMVEENQICIDSQGDVKIWMNGDLSINYSYSDVKEGQNKDERDMVRGIVEMIHQNTDHQSQPSPNFQQYYNQTVSEQNCNLDKARTLVLNYSKMVQVQIPTRFQAIFHLQDHESPLAASIAQKTTIYHHLHNPSNLSQDASIKPSSHLHLDILRQPTLQTISMPYSQRQGLNIIKNGDNVASYSNFTITNNNIDNSKHTTYIDRIDRFISPHMSVNNFRHHQTTPFHSQLYNIQQPIYNQHQYFNPNSQPITINNQLHLSFNHQNINKKPVSNHQITLRNLIVNNSDNHHHKMANIQQNMVIPKLIISNSFQSEDDNCKVNEGTIREQKQKRQQLCNNIAYYENIGNPTRQKGVLERDRLTMRYYSNLQDEIQLDSEIAADLIKYN